MIGAIIGDIVGSRFEWNNIRKKEFRFFHPDCFFTDDTVMTLAVAKAITDCNADPERLSDQTIVSMQEVGRPYPHCGYGGRFYRWLYSDDPKPYNSLGNGSGMRVSAVAWAARDLEECIAMSKAVTEVTHNHPEGIKGAEAIAVATYLALHGASKEEIRAYTEKHYYRLDFTLDGIRDAYTFDVTCMGTVPQAIEAFLESESFEDAIRNAISIGGDSDTLAACTGAIAEAYYGVPENLRKTAKEYLDLRLFTILESFEKAFPPKIAKEAEPSAGRQEHETDFAALNRIRYALLKKIKRAYEIYDFSDLFDDLDEDCSWSGKKGKDAVIEKLKEAAVSMKERNYRHRCTIVRTAERGPFVRLHTKPDGGRTTYAPIRCETGEFCMVDETPVQTLFFRLELSESGKIRNYYATIPSGPFRPVRESNAEEE